MSDLILATALETKFPLQKYPVKIKTLVENAVNEHNSLLEKMQITPGLDLYENLALCADEALLQKSFSALLKNAIIFNKQKGDIHIIGKKREYRTLRDKFKGLEIKIRDSGIGITKVFHEKIFEKFFQINSKQTNENSGLGLYIAKKIIELHGGTLEVKSELNIGSEFTINLPIAS